MKIAELPLDSFRMLQALEWEDQFSSPNPPAQEHPMPLSKSGSSKSLADKGRAGSMENGVEGSGGFTSRCHFQPAVSLYLLVCLHASRVGVRKLTALLCSVASRQEQWPLGGLVL